MLGQGRTMNFQQKVGHFLEEMEYLGISKFSAAPLLYRYLWRLGIQEPPPYFSTFKRNFIIQNLGFLSLSIIVLCLMTMFFKLEFVLSITFVLPLLVFSSVFVFFNCVACQQQCKPLHLPNWEQYLTERHKLHRVR